jgi:autotransporter passenger strand-loop-strand repeat protein
MNIVYSAGTNYGNAPAWLPTVLAQVAAFFEKTFTNNVTINVTVNWVDLGSGVLASNSATTGGVSVSLATLTAALNSHAHTATQSAAYANLPSNVTSVYVAAAEADALGLRSGDAGINLNIGSNVDWSQADAFAAIAHEITETAMGRVSHYPSGKTTVMDMFRFSAPGVHDLSTGSTFSNGVAYFSTDNGATNLGTWNNDSSAQYDFGDWVVSGFPNSNDPEGDPIPNDAMGAQEGGVAPISETDIALMNVLGWNTDIVTSGDNFKVSSGVTSSGFVVMSGGALTVKGGGEADNTWYTDATGFNDGVIQAGKQGGAAAVGYIQSDGFEQSATMDAGGLEWVEAGGFAIDSTVMAYGSIVDFGVISNAVVSKSGEIDVEFTGSANFTSVLSGGVLSLHAGGVGFIDHIQSGGKEVVYGSALIESIAAGATEYVQSGGLDESSFISGKQYVYGVASGDVVAGAFAYEYVQAGGSALNAQLSGQGWQIVSSGGLASHTVVSSVGAEFVQSGGATRALNVLSGGVAYLSAGAFGDGVTVAAGGTLVGPGTLIHANSAAGVVSGVVVGDSLYIDSLEMLSGGAARSVSVISGSDQLIVDLGATATGTVVSIGGADVVRGVASNTLIGSGGTQYVSSSGLTLVDIVLAGGVDQILSGGQASGVTVSSGGLLTGAGVLLGANTVAGSVSGVTVGEAAHVDTLELLSGGSASGVTVVGVSDVMTVDLGATATATTVSVFGKQIVSGDTTNTVVASGGAEYVYSGGLTSATSVLAGGVQYLFAGGTDVGANVASGGRLSLNGETISSGVSVAVGIQNGTHTALGATTQSGAVVEFISGTVLSGGADLVGPSALVIGAVLQGGHEHVNSGGHTISTVVSSGGGEYVFKSGLSEDAILLSAGAAYVSSGGVALSATVSAGGALYVSAGGEADATALRGGGTEIVRLGGLASATRVVAGGGLQISLGGIASATKLVGGAETIMTGGVAFGTQVLSGGLEGVAAGGNTISATISSGGTLSVAAGGMAREAKLLAGGVMVVAGSATWSGNATLAGVLSGAGALVEAGVGTLVVSALATAFTGQVVADGGTVELAAASGLGGGSFDFANTAAKKTLRIDAADRPANGGVFATTLVDFDSSSATYVDLAGQAFVAGAKATLSGHTLTLIDGSYSATFTLSGTGASKYAVYSDGAGGTLIRAAAGSTMSPLLAHAIASFAPVGGITGVHTGAPTGTKSEALVSPRHLGRPNGL